MLKRGQAASEFLTTYGWMIIILTLVIVILVTIGIFKPPIPSECKVDFPFTCEDFVFREGGFELTLNIDKIASGNVVASDVLINNQPCSNVMVFGNSPGDLNLDIGINRIRCYGDINKIKEDDIVNAEVKIRYIAGDTNLEHTTKAVINGKVDGSNYMNNFDNRVMLSYDFDRDNYTGAIDDGYYNNHGVLNYVTSTTSGCASGKCYDFEEDSGWTRYISTSYPANFGLESFSIEFWFKPEVPPIDTGGRVIIGNSWLTQINPPRINGFSISWGRNHNSQTPNDYLTFAIGDGTIIGTFFEYISFAEGNDLHYGSIVMDQENGKIYKYIDGNEIQPPITLAFDASIGYLSDVLIGFSPYGGALPTYEFNGKIDNVRIYNRALTPEEIKDHYNELK